MRITLRKWLAIDNTNFDKSAKGANCKKKIDFACKVFTKKVLLRIFFNLRI